MPTCKDVACCIHKRAAIIIGRKRIFDVRVRDATPTFYLPLLPLADPDAVVQAARRQPEVLAAARCINTGGIISTCSVLIIGIEPASAQVDISDAQ